MTKYDTNNPVRVPLIAGHIILLMLELHPCKNVFDTATTLFPLV